MEFDRLFESEAESEAESKAECEAYFTVVLSVSSYACLEMREQRLNETMTQPIYETSLQNMDVIAKKQDFNLVFQTGELNRCKQFPDNKLICMTEQF